MIGGEKSPEGVTFEQRDSFGSHGAGPIRFCPPRISRMLRPRRSMAEMRASRQSDSHVHGSLPCARRDLVVWYRAQLLLLALHAADHMFLMLDDLSASLPVTSYVLSYGATTKLSIMNYSGVTPNDALETRESLLRQSFLFPPALKSLSIRCDALFQDDRVCSTEETDATQVQLPLPPGRQKPALNLQLDDPSFPQ